MVNCPECHTHCRDEASFCPMCGVRLTAAAQHTESHLKFVRGEIRAWARRGLLTDAAAEQLLTEYATRLGEVEQPARAPALSSEETEERSAVCAGPSSEAPPAQAQQDFVVEEVLQATPPSAPQPRLAALLEEWNLSWWYAFGALLLVVSEAAIVVKWGHTLFGRWSIAASLAAFTLGCFYLARLLSTRAELQVGGRTCAALGALLTPLNFVVVERWALLGSWLTGDTLGVVAGLCCAAVFLRAFFWLQLPRMSYLFALAVSWLLHSTLRLLGVDYPCYGLGFIPLAVLWALAAEQADRLSPALAPDTKTALGVVSQVTIGLSLAVVLADEHLWSPPGFSASLLVVLLGSLVHFVFAYRRNQPETLYVSTALFVGFLLLALWQAGAVDITAFALVAVVGSLLFLLSGEANLRGAQWEAFARPFWRSAMGLLGATLVVSLIKVAGDPAWRAALAWPAGSGLRLGASTWLAAAAYAFLAWRLRARPLRYAAAGCACYAWMLTAFVAGVPSAWYGLWCVSFAVVLSGVGWALVSSPHSADRGEVAECLFHVSFVPATAALLLSLPLGDPASLPSLTSVLRVVVLGLVAANWLRLSLWIRQQPLVYLAGGSLLLGHAALFQAVFHETPLDSVNLGLWYWCYAAALTAGVLCLPKKLRLHFAPLEVCGVLIASLCLASQFHYADEPSHAKTAIVTLFLLAALFASPGVPGVHRRSWCSGPDRWVLHPFAACVSAAFGAALLLRELGVAPSGVLLGGALLALTWVALASLVGRYAPAAGKLWMTPLEASAVMLTVLVVAKYGLGAASSDLWHHVGMTLIPGAVLLWCAARREWSWCADLAVAGWLWLQVEFLVSRGAEARWTDLVLALAWAAYAAGMVLCWHKSGKTRLAGYAALLATGGYYHLLQALLTNPSDWQPLLFVPYCLGLAAVGYRVWSRFDNESAQWVWGVAIAAAVVTVTGGVAMGLTVVVSSSLALYTASLAALTGLIRRGELCQAAVAVGSLTALYTFSNWSPGHPGEGFAAVVGLRMVVFAAALMALGVGLTRAAVERDLTWPLFAGGLLNAGLGVLLTVQPGASTLTVSALLIAGGISATARLVLGQEVWQHLSFACCLAAGYLVLGDLYRHGAEELAFYRSSDLYFGPVGLYLIGLGLWRRWRGRAPSTSGLCTVGLAVTLGSAFISSTIAGNSVAHDVAFIAGTVAATFIGLTERLKSFLVGGSGMFVLYALLSLGRQDLVRENWMIVGLVAGTGVIVSGLWFERRRNEVQELWQRSWATFSSWES